jgi:2-phosphosulfolactate phosphatase
MQITRLTSLAGAARATGPTVVIDTFRAFTTAAYAFAAGAERVVLAAEIDEARALAASIEDAWLIGEDGGAKPNGFDGGNSPGEVRATPRLAGRTLVQRTMAGTRCARAAWEAGAGPLYPASLVVAGATARAVRHHATLSIVASGRSGVEPAEEDEATADYVEAALTGTLDVEAVRRRAAASPSAGRLRVATWAHPDDLALCLEIDRFPFAMQAAPEDGLLVVRRIDA